jgi:hypothetical protein
MVTARWGLKLLAFAFFIILIAGIVIGGWEATIPEIEAAGDELPGGFKDFFRILFGAGLPDEMFYTYTIIPYLVVPFFGAFILIYFLVEQVGTIPAKFAAPFAIVVTLIVCVSGIFVKMVFALLFAFGFYGFLVVWFVLILAAGLWGVTRVGEKGAEIHEIWEAYAPTERELTEKISGLAATIAEQEKIKAEIKIEADAGNKWAKIKLFNMDRILKELRGKKSKLERERDKGKKKGVEALEELAKRLKKRGEREAGK